MKLSTAIAAVNQIIPTLLNEDNSRESQLLMGADLDAFLQSLREMPEDEVLRILQEATQDSEAYFKEYISKVPKKAKGAK